jgi:hypothetical protein
VEHLALYVNYTAGLTDGGTAPVGVSNAFQTMSPFKSKQLEAGVKVDWGNMVTQAAVFQIKKPSGYTDPVSNVYSYAGEQRNRGLELSTYGELQRGLRLMASAAFTQAKLTRIEDLSVRGNNAPNGPPHAERGRRLGCAGRAGPEPERARCVSRPSTWTTPTPCAPGWTRLDFGARYAMQVAGKPVVLRASIENLANRRYWLTTTVSSSYPTPWSARRAPSRCLRPSTSDTRQRFSGPALPPPPAAQGRAPSFLSCHAKHNHQDLGLGAQMEQPGLHRLHAAAVPDRPALIFHHEIGHLLGTEVEAPAMPADTHAPTWTTCWPWPAPSTRTGWCSSPPR